MRIFSFADLKKRFPDLFNRIKGYVLLASVLRTLRRDALHSYAKLQRFLQALEKGIKEHSLPTSLKSPIRELKMHIASQADPSLNTKQDELKLTLSGEDLALLAEIMRRFVRCFVKSWVKVLAGMMREIAGEGNNETINQFTRKVMDKLTKTVTDACKQLKPSMPSINIEQFHDEFVFLFNMISVSNVVGYNIRQGAFAFAQSMSQSLFEVISDMLGLHVGLSGHFENQPQDNFDEVFGEHDFFSQPAINPEYMRDMFFRQPTNPENKAGKLFPQQPAYNPEKDAPDAPELEEQDNGSCSPWFGQNNLVY